MYTVKPGEMDDWVEEWREKIVPLRQKHGFKVIGAWTIPETNQFVWIIRYEGPKSWKEVDDAYYASPERAALDPNPVRHLAKTDHWLLKPAK